MQPCTKIMRGSHFTASITCSNIEVSDSDPEGNSLTRCCDLGICNLLNKNNYQDKVPNNRESIYNYSLPYKTGILSIKPNPVNYLTEISYSTECICAVSIEIYDIYGNLISVLLSSRKEEPKIKKVILDVTKFVFGVYYCVLKSPYFNESRKIIVIH